MSGARHLVPDLLIAGVHKAGTSALAQMLGAHPGVDFATVKEPGFLHLYDNRDLRRLAHGDSVMAQERMADPQVYAGLFETAPDRPSPHLRAEASTVYFESPRARAAVAAARADGHRVQVLVSLRDPVRRAHSAWVWMRKAGLEPLDSFEEALAAEPNRRAEGWWIDYHYHARGFYLASLTAWQQAVGAHDCHTVPFERVVHDPRQHGDLHAMLGLDPAQAAPLLRANPSGLHEGGLRRGLARLTDRHDFHERRWKRALPEPVRRGLGRVRATLKRHLDRGLTPPPPLDPGIVAELRADYAQETDALSALLDIDLATLWWGDQAAEGTPFARSDRHSE